MNKLNYLATLTKGAHITNNKSRLGYQIQDTM